ncbi:hypothetical protein ACWGKQ_39355 [Streptomyces sp. NPDC054770]
MPMDRADYWWCGEGPYRHHPPSRVVCCQIDGLEFDRDTERQAVAVHEAGHAAVAFQLGLHVPSVSIAEPTGTRACRHPSPIVGAVDNVRLAGSTVRQMMTVLAAGERAEERWLHETGQWTEIRAFFVERAGFGDRETARARLAEFGQDLRFGTSTPDEPDPADWWRAHGLADSVLDGVWDKVLVLAERIADRQVLPGDEAAAVCGVTNPPTPPSADDED